MSGRASTALATETRRKRGRSGLLTAMLGAALSSLTLGLSVPAASAAPEAEPREVPQAEIELDSLDQRGAGVALTLEPGTYRQPDGTSVVVSERSTWFCQGRQEDPHLSQGAGGVIAKARARCDGPLPILIIVSIDQQLWRSASADMNPRSLVGQAEAERTVQANTGWSSTWYVPELGQPGADPGGYFRANHSGQIVDPGSGTICCGIGPDESNIRYIP